MPKKKLSREQWILAKQMAVAVACLNAPFCDNGPAFKKVWIDAVAREIASNCGGMMALEDAIHVLHRALELYPEEKVKK